VTTRNGAATRTLAGVTEKEQVEKIGWENRGKSRKLETVALAHQMAGRAAIGRHALRML